MATHTLTYQYSSPSGNIQQSLSKSASGNLEIDESVSNNSTDLAITCAIDVSAVASFFIISTANVTVETNNASSPTNTLTLVADEPYVWTTDSLDTFKLTGDVTVMYVTNVSGSTAALKVRVLQDSTP